MFVGYLGTYPVCLQAFGNKNDCKYERDSGKINMNCFLAISEHIPLFLFKLLGIKTIGNTKATGALFIVSWPFWGTTLVPPVPRNRHRIIV